MLASSHKLFDGENGGAEFWEEKKTTVWLSPCPLSPGAIGVVVKSNVTVVRPQVRFLAAASCFSGTSWTATSSCIKAALVCQPFNSGRSFLHLIWYDLVIFSYVRLSMQNKMCVYPNNSFPRIPTKKTFVSCFIVTELLQNDTVLLIASLTA